MLMLSLKMIPDAGMSATCRRLSAACAAPIDARPLSGTGKGLEESMGRARPAKSFREALALASGPILLVLVLVAVLLLALLSIDRSLPLPPGLKIWRTACRACVGENKAGISCCGVSAYISICRRCTYVQGRDAPRLHVLHDAAAAGRVVPVTIRSMAICRRSIGEGTWRDRQ